MMQQLADGVMLLLVLAGLMCIRSVPNRAFQTLCEARHCLQLGDWHRVLFILRSAGHTWILYQFVSMLAFRLPCLYGRALCGPNTFSVGLIFLEIAILTVFSEAVYWAYTDILWLDRRRG